MYRTCIFCSADLGSNDVLEFFPVGSRLAFDARRGRLWAICRKCTRWNLAPIEERWEAVEEAEEKFRGSRMRVQSENIGMAKMPDGTQLVRVGSALQGELAAWRYGSQLVKRRTNLYMALGAGAVTGGVLIAGFPLIAGIGIPATMVNPAIQLTSAVVRQRAARRVVLKLPAETSPTGDALVLQRRHLDNAQLSYRDGQIAMSILEPSSPTPWYRLDRDRPSGERMWLTGDAAHMLAARAMVDYNSKGANKKDVANALNLLETAGSAENYIAKIGASDQVIVTRRRGFRRQPGFSRITPRAVMRTFRGEPLVLPPYGLSSLRADAALPRTEALALEMALHDEAERRAMEGELEILEDAWRDAEEIARIADALPGEPPEE